MTAKQFINDWIHENPESCAGLAYAVLLAYCLDRDGETSEEFINVKKRPDSRDVDRTIVDAIRKTTFSSDVNNQEFLWAGFTGQP